CPAVGARTIAGGAQRRCRPCPHPGARRHRQTRTRRRSPARGRPLNSLVHVYDIPMRVRFRGQDRRRGLLVEGPAGWGESSPFPEYDAQVSSRWLAAALEAANDGWPAPRRDRIPVNTTVPAVGPSQAHQLVAASGCTTAKVKVAERGQSLAEDIDRVAA